MSVAANQCPQCGSLMKQIGADLETVQYRCPACGFIKAVPVGDDGNAEYTQRRMMILSRIRAGFIDWRVTQWDRLHHELVDFISRYEAAQTDIQLQMSLVACITNGFNFMDAEKYKQCKVLYKFTEKMYKQHLKVLKNQADPKLTESVNEYKELRAKYKKCRNEYRNTKLAWKAVFFVFKKLAMPM